ncbi:MAG TPA: hypothetical protein VD866_31050 [Urbifossiella sp.]|nr:hypothetical protein [Urbifossiella sp.]
MIRPRISVLAALGCAAVAGCYQKVAEGTTLVYSCQPWLPVLLVVAGVAAVPLGVWVFRRKSRMWGVVLAVAGPVAAGVVGPTMFLDRVMVTDDGFTSRHGFWWSPSVHEVRYDDLANVRLVEEERSGRRGKNYSYFFDCTFKSCKQERVPLGDVMREALPEIAVRFREHDVPVALPPNLPN